MIELVIFFLIEGKAYIVPGYEPHPQPSMEICEMRKDFAETYVESLREKGQVPKFVIECVEDRDPETVQGMIDYLMSEDT